LFVSDEVICGFGRTGNWFGCETFETEPDLMTTAKGLTSGYIPLGAVMVSKKIAEVFKTPGNEFNHGYTYSGHPVSCAAAIANLKIIKKEKLVSRVRDDIGPYLQKQWKQLAEHPLVGEAVMTGLMGALELVPDKKNPSKRFENEGMVGTIARDFSFNNGLIMRAVRDRLVLSPPLTLTHEEADALITIAKKTLDDTHHALIKQGLMQA
jgi:putrescine aminotransferase